jgi:PD-(D/E)XK nuclease superfamily
VRHHQESTERIVALAVEAHRHSGAGLLDPFYAASVPGVGACRQLDPARSWNSGEYKGEPVTPKFRADILATGTAIRKIKGVPTLLPVLDMELQTYSRMSDLPVSLLRASSARRPSALHRYRNALLRGPPWPSFCLRVEKSLA